MRSFKAAPVRSWEAWKPVVGAGSLALFSGAATMHLEAGTDTGDLLICSVSASYLPTVQATAIFGALFSDSQDAAELVLAEPAWRRYPSLQRGVGAVVRVNGTAHRFAGVAAASAQFPEAGWCEGWTLLPDSLRRDERESRARRYRALVRTADPQRTIAGLQAAQQALAAQFPETHTGYSVAPEPLREALLGRYRMATYLLAAAALAVALIAFTNCASLLLVRAVAEARESSLREALGATPWQLWREHLQDAALLALPAMPLSLAACAAVSGFLRAVAPFELGPSEALVLSPWVALLAATAGAGVCFLLILIAAWLAPRRQSLGSRGMAGSILLARAERIAVAWQTALAVFLVAASGLLLTTVQRLRAVDPGFQQEHRYNFHVVLPPARYGAFETKAAFYRRMLEELASWPGALSVGGAGALPLSGSLGSWMVFPEGQPLAPPGQEEFVFTRYIGPGYLPAMGISLLEGRSFTEREYWRESTAVLVNRAMARRFWPSQPAVGQRLKLRRDGPWLEVVGVVADARQRSLRESAGPELLQPYSIYRDFPKLGAHITFLIAMTAGQRPTTAQLRAALDRVDPSLAATELEPLETLVRLHSRREEVVAWLVTGYMLLALFVAATGIAAAVRGGVARRWKEFAVRCAIGAAPAKLGADLGWQLALLLAPGLLIGLVGGLASARALDSLLFGLPAHPGWYAMAAVALLAMVAGCCALPSFLQLMNLKPSEVLRDE
jgi:putative ABC transport system permease protein